MDNDFNDFYFKTRMSDKKRRRAVWKQVAKYLQKYVDGTVVDIGCGHSDFLRFISPKKKIGVDIYRSAEFPEDASFVKSSAQDFSKKVKQADVVFASNLLEHLEDEEIEKTIKSVRDILPKNGLFIIIQPNFKHNYKSYFDDYTHKKIFTDVSLSDYLRSEGFDIVECRPKFLPGSMKSRLPASELLVWAYLHSPIKPLAGQMLIVARKKK